MAPLPDAAWRGKFHRRLRGWYMRHARPLPWRQTCDPYRIWVSEIMLQQTQVATVVPYYERFVAVFPDVFTLAAAPEPHVLRLWEGLGYYRRARQLHQAAQHVVAEHGGQFPRDLAAARALPGIGRYTAGAILSIAFGDRHPILEANTLRLFSRLLAYRGNPRSSAGQRLLWQFGEHVLPRKDAGTFNQALMELGSAVCRRKEPMCVVCPVAGLCPTRLQGLQKTIPAEKPRRGYQQVCEVVVVVRRGDKVLVRRCGPSERWSGMWDFPRFPVSARSESLQRREIVHRVRQLTGVTVAPQSLLTTIKHGVTRFRITLSCYQATHVSGRLHRRRELQWSSLAELTALPWSVTGRHVVERILATTT
jgi:A/G-specific adenine glycosylase